MPAMIITITGCNFMKYTNINETIQIPIEQITSYVSDPKFAVFIRSNAADAINPTATGRMPINIPLM